MADITRWLRPGARRDFLFTVGDEGDTIMDQSVVVVPTGSTTTVEEGAIVEAGASVQVWVTGGVLGEQATVRCTIMTNGGRIDTKELGIVIGYHD